ncbi:hypothetical protein ACLOJK_011128 [Asimina triloba]
MRWSQSGFWRRFQSGNEKGMQKLPWGKEKSSWKQSQQQRRPPWKKMRGGLSERKEEDTLKEGFFVEALINNLAHWFISGQPKVIQCVSHA